MRGIPGFFSRKKVDGELEREKYKELPNVPAMAMDEDGEGEGERLEPSPDRHDSEGMGSEKRASGTLGSRTEDEVRTPGSRDEISLNEDLYVAYEPHHKVEEASM